MNDDIQYRTDILKDRIAILEKALQSITNILFDHGYINIASVPVDILRRIVVDVKNDVSHDYNAMVVDYLKSPH